MGKYILSCCSTADLSKEHFEEIDVKYVCFHFELNGKQYLDNLGESIPFKDFYKTLTNKNSVVKTSQVNADEFYNFFKSFLEEGYDILHLSLSSGISGVINSATIAQAMLKDEFPDRKIYVIDSLGASSGYGLIMDKLSELRAGGWGIDEVYKWAKEHVLNLQHWFFSTDLTYYVRGGRISKASGFIGNILNICPLLNMDGNGKLIPRYKIRTKKKVIQAIVEKMEQFAKDGLDYCEKCYISHSDCLEDAKAVAELVESKFKKLKGKVEINYVGTTIGSHTGPGTVALFFWGSSRAEV